MRSTLLYAAATTGAVASLAVCIAAGGPQPFGAGLANSARQAGTAAVFFVQSITAGQIRDAYHVATAAAPGRVKILIVPGHQPSEGGTEYGGLYERDLVVDIAESLAALLRQNPRYEVAIARTKTAWNPVLETYFTEHAADIDQFRRNQAAQMASYIADGSFSLESEQVYHTNTPTEAARKLYGINKWASDNGYHLTLHLHLNDYAGRRRNGDFKYSGFAVYVPDPQYSNAAASRAVGEDIAYRLAAYHATSTLPKEDQGVVPDRQLIAVGANNSADDASILIEYGYIFEPQFQDPSIRPLAIADYAYQTYLGLQDFMGDPVATKFGALSIPADWDSVSARQGEQSPGIYGLQAALHRIGFYPPRLTTFADCPITGKAGACTKAALTAYQNARGVTPTGELGPETRAALTAELLRS